VLMPSLPLVPRTTQVKVCTPLTCDTCDMLLVSYSSTTACQFPLQRSSIADARRDRVEGYLKAREQAYSEIFSACEIFSVTIVVSVYVDKLHGGVLWDEGVLLQPLPACPVACSMQYKVPALLQHL
jgi:hypothetical protein